MRDEIAGFMHRWRRAGCQTRSLSPRVSRCHAFRQSPWRLSKFPRPRAVYRAMGPSAASAKGAITAGQCFPLHPPPHVKESQDMPRLPHHRITLQGQSNGIPWIPDYGLCEQLGRVSSHRHLRSTGHDADEFEPKYWLIEITLP